MRLLLSLLALSTVAVAQLPNSVTPTAVTFDQLNRSNPGVAFDHGYVAAWDLVQAHSLTLYDPNGTRLFDLTSLTLPDGVKTNAPLSIDIDSDGTSAIAWFVNASPRHGFAILDEPALLSEAKTQRVKAGNPIRIVETQPYWPSQICFAPDHSIWMFGQQLTAAQELANDWMTFRHYSRDGKLLGSFVPRSTLPPYEGAGLDNALGMFGGHWRLRASKDRLGAALQLSGFKQAWIELNFQGELIGQWTFSSVMPLAFDENNVLYGGHWTDRRHYNLLVFDKSSSTWKPLPPHPAGLLVGADGTRLVYKTGDQLHWTDAPTPATETAALNSPRSSPH